MSRLVIKPGAVIDGTGASAKGGLAVLVEDGWIAWVGRAADLGDGGGADVVEEPGATLLPGLIDCHVHLMCPAERCAPETYMAASDGELLVRAVAKAQAGLRAGVTTMRDLGSRNFLLTALRDAISTGQVIGPRLVLAGPAITRTGGHFHYLGAEADTADELRAAVRRIAAGGVDLIKVMATGGRTTVGTDPEAPQYSAEQLRAAVDEAHGLGLRLTAHAHGVQGIRNAAAAGADCVEHCSWVGPGDKTAYDHDTAQRMVDAGMYVSPTFGARARMSRDELAAELAPVQVDEFWDRQETRFEAMQRMIAIDARMVASSDAGMPNTHTHDFALTVGTLVDKLRMPELLAIRAATSLAAEALGIAGETGSVAAGKAADLLLVEGDPSKDISALRRIRYVFRGGEAVARGTTEGAKR